MVKRKPVICLSIILFIFLTSGCQFNIDRELKIAAVDFNVSKFINKHKREVLTSSLPVSSYDRFLSGFLDCDKFNDIFDLSSEDICQYLLADYILLNSDNKSLPKTILAKNYSRCVKCSDINTANWVANMISDNIDLTWAFALNYEHLSKSSCLSNMIKEGRVAINEVKTHWTKNTLNFHTPKAELYLAGEDFDLQQLSNKSIKEALENNSIYSIGSVSPQKASSVDATLISLNKTNLSILAQQLLNGKIYIILQAKEPDYTSLVNEKNDQFMIPSGHIKVDISVKATATVGLGDLSCLSELSSVL